MIPRRLGTTFLPDIRHSFDGCGQDIIRTAFDAGINMFDTAEAYAAGKSEIEMCVQLFFFDETGAHEQAGGVSSKSWVCVGPISSLPPNYSGVCERARMILVYRANSELCDIELEHYTDQSS